MGSLAPKGYLGVVPFIEDDKEHRRLLAAALNNAIQGKLNNTADFALNKNATSTTVSDVRAGPRSMVVLTARNLEGADKLYLHYISNRTNGSFTVGHLSTSTSDCLATYAIFG